MTALAALILLLVVVKACSPEDAPAPGGQEATATAAASLDPKVCDDALAALTKAGLIKERPAPNRINVDETMWARLPATQKKQTAAAVRCSLTRGGAGGFGDYGVVYGYRSGKRLAMATDATTISLE